MKNIVLHNHKTIILTANQSGEWPIVVQAIMGCSV